MAAPPPHAGGTRTRLAALRYVSVSAAWLGLAGPRFRLFLEPRGALVRRRARLAGGEPRGRTPASAGRYRLRQPAPAAETPMSDPSSRLIGLRVPATAPCPIPGPTPDHARPAWTALHLAAVTLFSLTVLTSAALLFTVQPMFAKMALPLLGGTPAVWNTCMVFFQAVLLIGYGYAHATPAALGLRRQAAVHVGLLLI